MAVQTYNYNATYDFNVVVQIRHEINGVADVQQALADVLQSIPAIVQPQFTAKLVASGHWFKVNGITAKGTTGTPTPHTTWYGGMIGIRDGWDVPVNGTALVDFDCDVADMMAHNSPQLWDIIIAVATAVVDAIVANPQLFLIGCIVVIALVGMVFVLNSLTNLTKALTKFFENPGGAIAGIAAVIVAGVVLIVALPPLIEYLSGRKKRKASRKS